MHIFFQYAKGKGHFFFQHKREEDSNRFFDYYRGEGRLDGFNIAFSEYFFLFVPLPFSFCVINGERLRRTFSPPSWIVFFY